MFSSGRKVEVARRIDHQPAAGEPFADVIVGVAFQFERDAFGQERPEALPGRAGEFETDGIVRQARRAVPAARSRRDSMAPTVRCTLRIGSLISIGVWLSMRLARMVDQLVIERLIEAVILLRRCSGGPRATGAGGLYRIAEKSRPLRLPVIDGVARLQHVDAAHHLVHVAEAQLRHVSPHLLGDEEEEIDDVLGLAR